MYLNFVLPQLLSAFNDASWRLFKMSIFVVSSFLLSLFIPVQSAAQSSEPVAQAERFMNIFMQSGYGVFVDSVFAGNKWFSTDSREKLKLDYSGYFSDKINGEIYGYDLLSTAKISDRLYSLTFLVRTERTPYAFHLSFYRPNKDWRIHSLSFDSNLDDELNETEKWKRQSATDY